MNKIFTVFLLLIFSFGIISCADNDSSGATSQMGNVLDQPNSTDDENSMNLPVITGSCYLLDNSTHDNSTIDNSSISDNSSITSSTVINCSTVVTNSTIDNSTLDNSTIIRSNVDNSSTTDNSTISGLSDIDSSYVCGSTVDNSTIDNSTICLSIIDNSTIRDSTVDNNSNIDNSTITDSNIDNSSITDSNIDNSTTSGGSNFDNVTGDNVTCVNCDLDDLICNGCVLDNATVCNATLDNVTLTNVTACQVGIDMDLDNVTIENQTVTETNAPYVASFSPGVATLTLAGSLTVALATDFAVTFNEAMDTDTIITSVGTSSCSGATFMVSLHSDNFSSGNCLSMLAAPVASNDNKTFTIDTTAALAANNAYYLIKVTTGAKDTSGNALSGNGAFGWTSDNVSIIRTCKLPGCSS